MTEFSFSQALDHVKAGCRATRSQWSDMGHVFIFLVPGSTFKVNRPPLLRIYDEGTEIQYLGHIDMRDSYGRISPWQPTQDDMLANDWSLVEPSHG